MKRKIFKYLIVMVIGLLFTTKVNAATSVSVSANKSNVVVGNTVVVTVTYSSSNILAQLYGTFSYNTSLFQYVSGSQPAISWVDTSGENAHSKTYTYTLKAISSGTATFTVVNASVYLLDIESLDPVTPSVGSVKTTVITQSQLEASYSKNNYLSSLSVEGHEISPEFKKDTLEYTVELPNGIESIVINASREDWKSSIRGTGTILVNEGVNKIEIVVTAENGNEKIYTIIATVKELNPVVVTINGEEYNVIRKEGILDLPSLTYEKTTTVIKGEDVLAYYSDVTKYTLVGLKNSEGEANYYIYDSDKETYILYREYNFNGLILNIQDMKTSILPSKYKKSTMTIDDDDLTGYVINTNIKGTYAIKDDEYPDFYLFYALNVSNGESGLYVLDKAENTVQRYNASEVEYYKNKSDTYFVYIIILLGIMGISITVSSIILLNKNKISHQKKKMSI